MKPNQTRKFLNRSLAILLLMLCIMSASAQKSKFKVIAFYTGKDDLAHVSFVHEANKWFPQMAAKYKFSYDSTANWSNMNAAFLAQYQVILFLDTRPEKPEQRAAFETFMRNGGSWMGFHFSAFALTPSAFNQDWDWYHNEFLGSGQYGSNTWRPTSAVLRVEDSKHPATKSLPATFKSAPNEWYRWEKDLRNNPDIDILLAIDSTSFPLGTGPKQHEIWKSGYYPVAWSNKKYNMIYVNMGHNDMDYEHKYDKTNKTLSNTFDSEGESKFIMNGLLWLGSKKKTNK
jgi:hypothetical protein